MKKGFQVLWGAIPFALTLMLMTRPSEAESIHMPETGPAIPKQPVKAKPKKPVVTKKKEGKKEVADAIKGQALPDQVVQFRQNHYLYTIVPLKEIWTKSYRAEVFYQSQRWARLIMKEWLRGASSLSGEHQLEESDLDFIETVDLEKVREEINKREVPSMPTARRIIEEASSAPEAIEKLKKVRKFEVEIDKMLDTYEQYRDKLYVDQGEDGAWLDWPDAFIFYVGGKMPRVFIDWVSNITWLKPLVPLLYGSVTFSVVVRPWMVEQMDLDTGEVKAYSYYDASTQLWINKDFQLSTGEETWRGNWRGGAGLLWGDIDRMQDIHGPFSGVSKSFRTRVAGLPVNTNVKGGVITESISKLGSGGKIFKYGYFLFGLQKGLSAAGPGPIPFHGNAGYIFNLSEVAGMVESAARNQGRKIARETLGRSKDEAYPPNADVNNLPKKPEDKNTKNEDQNSQNIKSSEIPVEQNKL